MTNQLRLFIGMAQCGSFAKAAEQLFLSAPALMNQLDNLERRLCCRLFERSNRGLKLTAAGQSFYADAQKIVALTDEAMLRARKIAEQNPYTLSIGSSALNPYTPFVELFNQVVEREPKFKLKVVAFDDDRQGILSIIERLGVNFDLLLGCAGSRDWTERCNFLQLGEKKICFAVPLQHPLAHKAGLSIEDLDNQHIMLMGRSNSDNNNRMLTFMQQHCPGSTLSEAPAFYDLNVFVEAAEKQCLLAILEHWSGIHPGFKTLKVDWDFAIPYGIMYSRTPSPQVKVFLDCLGEILQQA